MTLRRGTLGGEASGGRGEEWRAGEGGWSAICSFNRLYALWVLNSLYSFKGRRGLAFIPSEATALLMLFLFSILLVTDLRFRGLENTSCFKSWCIRVSQQEPALHTETSSVYHSSFPVSEFQSYNR